MTVYTQNKLFAIIALFILPYLGYSQQYEYLIEYDNSRTNYNIKLYIEQIFYKDKDLYIFMNFENLENENITLIKPDTSMIECSVLNLYHYTNSKKKYKISLSDTNLISQLACLSVKSSNEIFCIRPNEKVFHTIIIPINDKISKNSQMELIIDYEYDIISDFELINIV